MFGLKFVHMCVLTLKPYGGTITRGHAIVQTPRWCAITQGIAKLYDHCPEVESYNVSKL